MAETNETEKNTCLREQGFFYTKEGDIVECFACGIRVSQLKNQDIATIEHNRYSPDCVYMKLMGTGENEIHNNWFTSDLNVHSQWNCGVDLKSIILSNMDMGKQV